jgi:predicted acylesterase/phospholipase RssA
MEKKTIKETVLDKITRKPSKPRSQAIWKYNPDNFSDFVKKRKGKKLVLALSAGKLKIACHLATLRLIETLDMKVDEVWGVSAGAIVGGLWAHGMKASDIYEALDEISISSVFDIFNPEAVKSAFVAFRHEDRMKTAGIVPGIQIEKLLRNLIENSEGENQYVDPENFYAIAYNITKFHKTVLSIRKDGKVRHMNMKTPDIFTETVSDGDLADIMRASIAMSGIYWPKEIGGEYYLDGGITEHLPIRSPFLTWVKDVELGKEDRDLFIVGLEAAFWSPDTPLPANPFNITSESFEILGVELSMAHEFHIRNFQSAKGPKAELVVIRPQLPYTKINKMPDFSKQIRVAKASIIKELSNK